MLQQLYTIRQSIYCLLYQPPSFPQPFISSIFDQRISSFVFHSFVMALAMDDWNIFLRVGDAFEFFVSGEA